MQRPITIEESIARPCSLRVGHCAGPTASGIGGFACEQCLASLVDRFSQPHGATPGNCSYCGAGPVVQAGTTSMCSNCAQRALTTARSWYKAR